MKDLIRHKRQEDKYVLTREQYFRVCDEVEKHLKLYSYDGKEAPGHTDIFSIYMDSYDLVSFKKHVNGDDNRSKVRIRKYKPNSRSTGETHIELKEKVDGKSQKSRYQIDRNNMSELKRGQSVTISPTLKSINENVDAASLRVVVNRTNTLLKVLNEPSLEVSYEREAYGTDNFRVTFDCNFKWRSAGFNNKLEAQRIKDRIDWGHAEILADQYDPKYDCIMEVKHNGTIPKWLELILKSEGIDKVSFSKYVKACVEAIKKLTEK